MDLSMNTWIISTIVVVLGYVGLWLKQKYLFFQSSKVTNPPVVPILGHLQVLLKENIHKLLFSWTRTYGKVFGLYIGIYPRLFIADPETVMQVCVRDFDAFTDHCPTDYLTEHQQNFLFLVRGNKWRKMRAYMSPTFTSAKIRRMSKLLDACSDDLMNIFHEQIECNEGDQKHAIVNVKEIFSLYTMDTTTSCLYGLKLDRAVGVSSLQAASTRNGFVRACMTLFKPALWRALLPYFLPSSLLRYFNYTVAKKSDFECVAKIVSNLIDARRNVSQSSKFQDYLQLLVDAKLEKDLELDNLDSAENHYAGLTHETLQKEQRKLVDELNEASGKGDMTMSQVEVVGSAIFLLVVGLETTGTMLAYCCYALAFHQEIQDRLYREVRLIAKKLSPNSDKYEFDYEDITTCEYLDAVISETLRYMPVAIYIDRISNREFYFKKWDLHIPKNFPLYLGTYSLHHDPDYWDEPEVFQPDRFLPENKHKIVPGSYLPFGVGPRHCVGMRFSLTESKLAIAKAVLAFRFEPVPGLKFPGELGVGFGPTILKDPRVKIVPRNR